MRGLNLGFRHDKRTLRVMKEMLRMQLNLAKHKEYVPMLVADNRAAKRVTHYQGINKSL